MYGYIYETTNIINGKKYIGKHKSTDFDCEYLGSGVAITEAVKKYGKENFVVTLLEECDSLSQLNAQEVYWIKKFNAVNDQLFYNIAPGGDGGVVWKEGNHPSKHTNRTGIKNPFYGKHHTDMTKEKVKECWQKKIQLGYESPIKNTHQVRKDNVIKYISEDDIEYYVSNGWSCTYYEELHKIPKKRKASEHQKMVASKTHKGKKISQEQLEKFKLTLANKTPAEKLERSIKASNSQKNLCWVSNETETLRIHKKDLEEYINIGYVRGRKFK